jgi:selenocysteine lyase/cysteine desulfurase
MPNDAAATVMDTARARVKFREDFFDFEDAVYLNLAGQSPIPRASAKALEAAVNWKKLPHNVPEDAYFGLPDGVRALLAQMINAQPEEFAITSGASAGMQAVANGIEWQPDDEVLIARGEFPAHFSTWMPLHHAGKLRVRIVEPAGRFHTTDDFLAAITPRTRLISASHVRFDNAARIDPLRLAEAVHKVGGLLLLDASQSLGAVPIDAQAMKLDFLVASGYKWLLSPFGTGVFWARRDLIDQLRIGPFYWMALEGAHIFSSLNAPGAKHVPVPGQARRWDAPETANFFNLSVMHASIEYVMRAGADTVFHHNARLMAQMIERLPVDRCILASPADQVQRGPYACFAARSAEKTAALFEKLRVGKIYVSLREGALRVAPYLYNTEQDIDKLIAAITV